MYVSQNLAKWITFDPSMNKQLQPIYIVGWYYLYIRKILKFGNGCIISSHTLLNLWSFIHARNEVNPYQ